MKQIKLRYLVKEKSKGPPSYYLGNDYKRNSGGRWCIGCKTYLTETLRQIEIMFGILVKKDSQMVDGDHPKMDESALLNHTEHQQYQMLIGMLN